jgi:hypothetical protein
MNGRVYDYNLGRFLSVDPFIQAPTNSQSANPYSYIMNNPMAGTDPTGYCATDDQMGDCVDGLEEGVPQAITNAEGETVGHIGKDGNGNIHISNGSSDGLKAVTNSILDVGKASGTNVNQSPSNDSFIDKIKSVDKSITEGIKDLLPSVLEMLDPVTPIQEAASEINNSIKAGTIDPATVGAVLAGVALKKIRSVVKVAEELLEKTPFTNKELFKNVKGCKGKCSIETGEIWERDLLHKNQPHFEVYKNKKNFEKGKRDRAVWEDGRLKQEFKK